MKNSLMIVSLCGILTLAFTGCTRKNNPGEYFPDQLGYKWNYDVFDSLKNKSEQLTVSVIDVRYTDGVKSNVWLFQYPDRADTFYVSEIGDTVVFDSPHETKRIYVTPFTVGEKWRDYPVGETVVTGMENVTVEAGTFINTYVIERNTHSFNYWLHEKINFVPGVGIVKLYINEYDLGPGINETWELKNYRQ